MKEHQMYPNNPNSAESILTEKLKDVSYGWVDNQRAIVLEAMEQYAKSERNHVLDEAIEIISSYRSLDRTQLKEILQSLKYRPMEADKQEKKVSAKERMYLSWQKSDKTWRQFWEEIQGENPHWMTTTQYGGDWLDKKMNDPI